MGRQMNVDLEGDTEYNEFKQLFLKIRADLMRQKRVTEQVTAN